MSSTSFRACTRHLSTRAGPKPFPSPYNVGIDIAKISRFKNIIDGDQHQTPLNTLLLPSGRLDRRFTSLKPRLCHFIRKVFNHDEWSRLEPVLSFYAQAPDESKRISDLARYLAGRWAAKEAAIKAHACRRLHYRDVTVLYQKDVPGNDVLQDANAPVVLINPPKPEVHMSETIALQRGLWQHHAVESGTVRKSHRTAKTHMHERQIARVSISHDGDYAISVVYALDEPTPEQDLTPLIDDGHGEAIHEPLLGDAVD